MQQCLKLVLLLFCFSISLTSAIEDAKLPSYVNVCYRKDPKVAECIKNAIQKLVPIFKSGSSDFDLFSLDPLKYSDLSFNFQSAMINGKMIIPNVSFDGMKNIKVLKVRHNLKNPKKLLLDFDCIFPYITLQAKTYNFNGKVLSAPVQVSGRLDLKFIKPTLTFHVDADVTPKNKVDYLTLRNFTWRFFGDSAQDLLVQNNNVVSGNAVINSVVLGVLKSAWRPLLNQMLPYVLPSADAILTKGFIKFFAKYPYDVLFPKQKLKFEHESITDVWLK